MSRGRYSTSAEARQARETAETEVVAGRRKIVELTSRVAELEHCLGRERAAHRESVTRLNRLVEEGTSAEVAALKLRLRQEKTRSDGERRARASEVCRVLNVAGFAATRQVYDALCTALGVPAKDFFAGQERPLTRRARRHTYKLTRGYLASDSPDLPHVNEVGQRLPGAKQL